VEGRYALLYNDGEKVMLQKGEAVLIPAVTGKVTMIPDGKVKILESFMNLDDNTEVKSEIQ
jgi:uncharacterized protein YjlB